METFNVVQVESSKPSDAWTLTFPSTYSVRTVCASPLRIALHPHHSSFYSPFSTLLSHPFSPLALSPVFPFVSLSCLSVPFSLVYLRLAFLSPGTLCGDIDSGRGNEAVVMATLWATPGRFPYRKCFYRCVLIGKRLGQVLMNNNKRYMLMNINRGEEGLTETILLCLCLLFIFPAASGRQIRTGMGRGSLGRSVLALVVAAGPWILPFFIYFPEASLMAASETHSTSGEMRGLEFNPI